MVHPGRRRWTDGDHLQGARALAHHRASDLGVRRPRPAVRHHHQRLAHLPEYGAHQRLQSLLRVHVPRQFGVQPSIAEPAQVLAARRHLRDRCLQACHRDHHPGAGDHRRQRALPDTGDRSQFAALPAARPGLRQSRLAHHVARSALRLGARARMVRRCHGADDRLGLPNQRDHRTRRDRPLPRLRRK